MKYKNFLIILCCFIIAFLIIYFMPDYSLGYGNVGNLYINEVMPSNTFTLKDNDGDFTDWIEIYNGYDKDINLEGYSLTDDELKYNKWIFPKLIIKAKSYLIVYASDKDRCDNDICHTNFKLSNSGEDVILYNPNGEKLSKITYKNIENDVSYGLIKKDYGYLDNPTPGSENKGNISSSNIKKNDSSETIRINEYTYKNVRINYDEDGDYTSWVELYNYGDKDIDLKGFMLSDNLKKLGKYVFPDVKIKSKSYLLVYLSGKNKEYKKGSNLHTSFTLSSKDTNLVLADSKGNYIDKLKLVALKDNISYGLKDDEWVFFASPTPGKENKTLAFEMNDDLVLKKKIIINEVEAINDSFIELKNLSNEKVNLNGYYIKDKKGNKYKIKNKVINANGYYTISNKIPIGNSNERLYLYDNNNQLIDDYRVGRLMSGISSGIDNNGNRVYFTSITKNSNNPKSGYKGYSSEVSYSIDGGYVKKGTIVKLSVDDDSTIYYTIDGSNPSKSSKKYNNSGIKINETTVIKTVSYKSGYIKSEINSRTFFVGRKHNVAVVSLSTNYGNYFGPNGIYTNYRSNKEAPVSFEFYENDGSYGTSFNAGSHLVGQDSREFPQKSIAINLRKKYGLKEVIYPFFEDFDIQTFSSFTLRNSGEDTGYMKIKDAFLTKVLDGQMDLDYQKYRPVVVYINGKYYGLYNIREKINEDYVANRQNVDPDTIDLIKGNNDVRKGTIKNYENILKYMSTHDMKNDKVYEYVKKQVDVQELCNYWVVQTFYRNTDTGNIRFYKPKDGKWRWVLFDLDWAMYPSLIYEADLKYVMLPYGHGIGNYFSTDMTYYLFKNPDFKDLYLKTFAKHLKTTFKPSRMNKILDEVANEVRDEMPYHINRWSSIYASKSVSNISSMKQWEDRIANEKEVIKTRYNLVIKSLKSEFNLSNKQYEKYFGGL